MEILSYVIKTGFLAFLVAAAFSDLKKRSLGFIFLCISFTAGFVLRTISGETALWQMLAGSALGAAAALIAYFSRQAIGYGDCFSVSVCGAWLGLFGCVLLLLISLLIMAVLAIVLMAAKKVRAKDELPFMPFLLSGYVAALMLGLL